MSIEVLVHAGDPAAVKEEVAAVGGRLAHALTHQLLVISIPDSISVSSIRGASMADPEKLRGTERALAEAWLSKFKSISRATERLERAVTPSIPWDTAGYTPPNHLPGQPGPPALPADLRLRLLSTNTPTSITLTGSVAVGLVMVSGPSDPPPWTSIRGALKYVSVAADGTVWGVNSLDNIFRWNGNGWDQVSGQLTQISVGNAAAIWGVNAHDEIYRWNGAAWERVSGELKHVAVANDGTVWGVNSLDNIFRWNGNGWDQVSGQLTQISVGNAAAIWGVNAHDEIYRWNGAAWERVSGELKHVAVANDGTVWGVNSLDNIFRWNGNGWDQVSGQLTQISVGNAAAIWGVNSDDQIYLHPGLGLELTASEKALIMREVIEGLNFLQSAEPSANVSFVHDWKDISVDVAQGAGDDYEDFEAPWRNAALKAMGFDSSRGGSVDYANALRKSEQTDWSYVAYFTKYPLYHFGYASDERLVIHYYNDGYGPEDINKSFAHETCHIFGAADEYEGCNCDSSGHFDVPNNNCRECTTSQLPCLMNQNDLLLCAWSRGQIGWSSWDTIAGALKYISAASDGTVWGVNSLDNIFRWNGNGWDQVSGQLTQISVGNAAAIWGVNAQDEIYRWNGAAWERVSGKLKHVAVADDGTTWGVNSLDNIFRWNGNGWDQVSGQLTQISVGNAAAIWGVNAQDEIYRWNGAAWERVSGELKHVAVANDGVRWGVNSGDKIFSWNGNGWNQVPGALKQISAGAFRIVWGVNESDAIFRLR